ncbi:hypothetical protein V6Z11_A08G204900 [Gossypium hirsutum]
MPPVFKSIPYCISASDSSKLQSFKPECCCFGGYSNTRGRQFTQASPHF